MTGPAPMYGRGMIAWAQRHGGGGAGHTGAMTTMSRRVPVAAGWVGLVLMLVPLYWFIASGLLAPLWAIVALLALWTGALLWAIRSRRRRPWMVLALPFALMVFWIAFISAGEAWLGWTA